MSFVARPIALPTKDANQQVLLSLDLLDRSSSNDPFAT